LNQSRLVVTLSLVASFLVAPSLLYCSAHAAEDTPALEVVRLKPSADGKATTNVVDQMTDSLLVRITDKDTSEIEHKAAFDELVKLDEPAVDHLSGILKDPVAPFNNRWVAARALGKIGGPLATKSLRGSLASDKFSMIRLAAIQGLKDIRDEGSFDAYVKALGDDALVVRSAAADALGALGNPKAVPALVKALDREDNFYKGHSLWVRRHIVAAMGATDSRTTVPVFIKALDDNDPNVHREAIAQLERVTKVTFKIPASNQDEFMTKATPKWKAWWEENKKDWL
jgi:HEAT repeat protein